MLCLLLLVILKLLLCLISVFDNVLVAYEITHSMKGKKFRCVGFVGANLDMSKAYDRIKWKFVTRVIRALGFTKK